MKGPGPLHGLKKVATPQVSKATKMRVQCGTEFTLVNQDEDAIRAPGPEVGEHESLKEKRVK